MESDASSKAFEKVSKGFFNFEAFAGYNQAVRDSVALESYSQFATIETEDVFTMENAVKKCDKSSKASQAYRKAMGSVLDLTWKRAAQGNVILHINVPSVSLKSTVRRIVEGNLTNRMGRLNLVGHVVIKETTYLN